MDIHPAERLLRQACALESYERFHRVSYLLLAHAVMDRRLASALVDAEVTRRGGIAMIGLDELRSLAATIARDGTFGGHLRQARSAIGEQAGKIADDVNETRNAFVHDAPGWSGPPKHRGQDVGTAEGFRTCMDDVMLFLQLVPFHNPGWSANP
jgi:hypothetical protein